MKTRLKKFARRLFPQETQPKPAVSQPTIWDSVPADFQRGSDAPVLVVSGQKTGTHLLTGLLDEIGFQKGKRKNGKLVTPQEFIGRRPNEYLMSHNIPDVDTFGLVASGEIKVIFNYRDPRDVIVSNYYWTEVVKERDPASAAAGKIRDFRKQVQHALDDKQKSFQLMIRDIKIVPGDQGLDTWFREPLGLFFHPLVYKTRFESLVGPNGGGVLENQLETIQGLLEFLDVERDVDKLLGNVFNTGSKTFRKGKIQNYKTEFSAETNAIFLQYYGDILDIYGYPRV